MKYRILALLLFAGCAPYREIQTVKLQEGMTLPAVQAILKKKKDKTIAVKEYPFGRLAVYQYAHYEPWLGQVQDKYYLYFMNDTLIRYAPPEEWQEGAAKAIRKRYNR